MLSYKLKHNSAVHNRYGYQGSEKDDEITNVEGAHYTTYFREIDTRLGRMWSRDPELIPWQSPYTRVVLLFIWFLKLKT